MTIAAITYLSSKSSSEKTHYVAPITVSKALSNVVLSEKFRFLGSPFFENGRTIYAGVHNTSACAIIHSINNEDDRSRSQTDINKSAVSFVSAGKYKVEEKEAEWAYTRIVKGVAVTEIRYIPESKGAAGNNAVSYFIIKRPAYTLWVTCQVEEGDNLSSLQDSIYLSNFGMN